MKLSTLIPIQTLLVLAPAALINAQNQTIDGDLHVSGNADIDGAVTITGTVGATHFVSSSAQGDSAFYGRQNGFTFGSTQAIFTAISDNPEGNQNWFFRGMIGGVSGFESFSIRADGQIRSAALAGTGTALAAIDSDGNLLRSAYAIGNSGNIGIGTAAPADTLTANGNIRALASNNGGFMAYDSPEGGNHLFSLVRGNASNNLNISAYEGIGFSTNATTGPSSNYSMFITANGNVGIGTIAPRGKLDINGDLYGSEPFAIISRNPGANDWGNLILSAGGGSDATTGSSIALAGYGYTSIRFSTANSERIRISPNGNVGIGTDSPANTLVVKSPLPVNATSTINAIEITASGNGLNNQGGALGIIFNQNPGGSATEHSRQAAIHSISEGVHSNSVGLAFSTQTEASALAERVRVTSSGNVGIGTVTPEARLHVVGDSRVSGTITARKIRVPESGDLSMGQFQAGSPPTP